METVTIRQDTFSHKHSVITHSAWSTENSKVSDTQLILTSNLQAHDCGQKSIRTCWNCGECIVSRSSASVLGSSAASGSSGISRCCTSALARTGIIASLVIAVDRSATNTVIKLCNCYKLQKKFLHCIIISHLSIVTYGAMYKSVLTDWSLLWTDGDNALNILNLGQLSDSVLQMKKAKNRHRTLWRCCTLLSHMNYIYSCQESITHISMRPQ